MCYMITLLHKNESFSYGRKGKTSSAGYIIGR